MAIEHNNPKWFTIRQAAEYLQVGEPTIYRWMKNSKLTYRKVGDSTRFLQEDLDAMVQVFPAQKEVDHKNLFCNNCGSDEIIEGNIQGTGKIYFKPQKTKFWTFKDSNVKFKAYACLNCSNIQYQVDKNKLIEIRKENSEKD